MNGQICQLQSLNEFICIIVILKRILHKGIQKGHIKRNRPLEGNIYNNNNNIITAISQQQYNNNNNIITTI